MHQSALARFALLLLVTLHQATTVVAVIRFSNATQLYDGIQNGLFDVILDVRTRSEWESGHIENATFLDSLQRFNTSGQTTSPADLYGCRYECTIVVYCASGNRAGQAATILEAAGFHAPIYNGLGVNQWTSSGYELVTDMPSINPPCNQTTDGLLPRSCRTGELMPSTTTNPPAASASPTATPSATITTTTDPPVVATASPTTMPSTATDPPIATAPPTSTMPSTTTTITDPPIATAPPPTTMPSPDDDSAGANHASIAVAVASVLFLALSIFV